jgi:hypothetical protein
MREIDTLNDTHKQRDLHSQQLITENELLRGQAATDGATIAALRADVDKLNFAAADQVELAEQAALAAAQRLAAAENASRAKDRTIARLQVTHADICIGIVNEAYIVLLLTAAYCLLICMYSLLA